jgi:tRNA/tmRNA/rRNA uracil-C5-methylase (TrmA/RlmC/RlmD family)
LHTIKKNIQDDFEFMPINPSPTVWGYRNKMEYSFGNYISFKEGVEKRNLLGFHKQGEFSKVVDVTYSCL